MAKVDIMEIEKIDRDRKTGDNMDGEKRADDKLEAGVKFRDFKNLPGKTLTEKLQKAGIKNIPKTLTLQKAIELLKEKSK